MGATEVLIVLGVVVLLFGSSQVPKLARSLGQAKKELQAGMSEGDKSPDQPPENPQPSASEGKNSDSASPPQN